MPHFTEVLILKAKFSKTLNTHTFTFRLCIIQSWLYIILCL